LSGLPGGRWHPDWSGFRPLAADVGQLAFSLTPASPSFAKASEGIPEGEGKWAQQIYPPQEGSAARHNVAGKRAGSWKVRESS